MRALRHPVRSSCDLPLLPLRQPGPARTHKWVHYTWVSPGVCSISLLGHLISGWRLFGASIGRSIWNAGLARQGGRPGHPPLNLPSPTLPGALVVAAGQFSGARGSASASGGARSEPEGEAAAPHGLWVPQGACAAPAGPHGSRATAASGSSGDLELAGRAATSRVPCIDCQQCCTAGWRRLARLPLDHRPSPFPHHLQPQGRRPSLARKEDERGTMLGGAPARCRAPSGGHVPSCAAPGSLACVHVLL